MKIIALLPVKNEKWILQTTIPQLKKFVDEIIALDGGSGDESVNMLIRHGVQVLQQDKSVVNYSSWRQTLLDAGRAAGGTHFVWLDADEAFTTNFLTSGGGFRKRLAKMLPGEKLSLQWLCLWKSPYTYRDDTSIWSNLYKDFVVCDDGKIGFGTTMLHEGRTPGPNEINASGRTKSMWTSVPLIEGGVLHFQFVPFQKFQMKQAFQRCREYSLGNGSARRINNKYAATMDDPAARTMPIPEMWLEGIGDLENIQKHDIVNDQNLQRDQYFKSILNYFSEKGISYFEPLQIWHIPELHALFLQKTGREPKMRTYPAIIIQANKIKNKILKWIK